jgi:hypothetical protein
MCREAICERIMGPCEDCNISRVYKNDDQTGTYNNIINKKRCEDTNQGMPDKIYVFPNNIKDYSTTSSSQDKKGWGIATLIWWGIAVLYFWW